MMTIRDIVDHIAAQPFCPLRVHMASGRVFEVKHPEFAKVGLSSLTIYAPSEESPNGLDRWQQLSLLLIESVSPIGSAVDSVAR